MRAGHGCVVCLVLLDVIHQVFAASDELVAAPNHELRIDFSPPGPDHNLHVNLLNTPDKLSFYCLESGLQSSANSLEIACR